MQNLEVKATEALSKVTVTVDGRAVGEITIQVKAQSTIEGTKNAIVVVGSAVDTATGSPYGFVFQEPPEFLPAKASKSAITDAKAA